MVYFTSDLHLGHKAIPKYREPFKDMKSHDDYIIDKILELGKRDILLILGDFLFDGEHYDEYIERLSKKKCRIKLVMGNHDSMKLYKEDIFEIQLPLFSYKNTWLSHAPIHPQELRGRYGNVHGHLHLEKVRIEKKFQNYDDNWRPFISEVTTEDPRYFNVNLDVNDYKFVNFEEIKGYFNK